MKKLVCKPAVATIAYNGEEPDAVVFCESAFLTDVHEQPNTVELVGPYETRMIDCDDPSLFVQGRLEAVTSSGAYITVREYEPSDSLIIPGLPNYPVPSLVASAYLTGEIMSSDLRALVDDDGYVSTVLLMTDVGMWVRYSNAWLQLTDVEKIDGLDNIDIDDAALDLYDSADRNGRQVPISSLVETKTGMAVPDSVGSMFVASGSSTTFSREDPVVELPVIENPRQLITAAGALTADAPEEVRKYVEKRAAAFGIEMDLPWQ